MRAMVSWQRSVCTRNYRCLQLSFTMHSPDSRSPTLAVGYSCTPAS